MARILITYGVPADGFSVLSGHEVCIPEQGQAFSKDELLKLLPEADAVLACGAFDKACIEASPKLQIIVCYGAGYDKIDVSSATSRGIPVCNIPETVTASTAEAAFSLILGLARKIPDKNAAMHRADSHFLFTMGRNMGTSLDGATLGLVGMGRIGSKVADLGRAFGMKILYTCHGPKPERNQLGDEFTSLDDLLSRSDFVSLHCPLNAETKGLLSAEKLSLMKPTAYLINTARGPVTDEKAVMNALRTGKIAGAGIDVFTGEPHIDPEWMTVPNAILTPHMGSDTLHTRNLMARAASETILTRLGGKIPPHVLNPEVFKEIE